MDMPDNYDLWVAHQNRIEAERARLPKCRECDEPIEDEDCFEFDNQLICPRCLDDNHKKSTYAYIEEY